MDLLLGRPPKVKFDTCVYLCSDWMVVCSVVVCLLYCLSIYDCDVVSECGNIFLSRVYIFFYGVEYFFLSLEFVSLYGVNKFM